MFDSPKDMRKDDPYDQQQELENGKFPRVMPQWRVVLTAEFCANGRWSVSTPYLGVWLQTRDPGRDPGGRPRSPEPHCCCRLLLQG